MSALETSSKPTCNEVLQSCEEAVDALTVETKICEDLNKKQEEKAAAQVVVIEKLHKDVDSAETKATVTTWTTIGAGLLFILKFAILL